MSRSRRFARAFTRLLPAIFLLAAVPPSVLARQAPQSGRKEPIDFKVFKMDRPVAGRWEYADPIDGAKRTLELRPSGPEGRNLKGLLPDGKEVVDLEPKEEGIGYKGILTGLLVACGEDRLAVSEFLPLGDQAILRIEAAPPLIPCPFLEGPPTSRLFVAPAADPVRLRGAGEIVSERSREQIGLGGQRSGEATPILSDSTLVEGGTELRFIGRVRGLDGTIWIEVEGLVSPAPGIDPPRGFLAAGQIRVAASITLTRAPEPGSAGPR